MSVHGKNQGTYATAAQNKMVRGRGKDDSRVNNSRFAILDILSEGEEG